METPEPRRHTEKYSAEERQAEREVPSETTSIPETEDWFGKCVGIWREGDGLTLDEVLAEIRAMRDLE
jgi:hypothetical protein